MSWADAIQPLTTILLENDSDLAAVYSDAINGTPPFRLVGTARSIVDFRELIEARIPDLAIIDLDTTKEPTRELIVEISTHSFDTIILGSKLDSPTVRLGFSRGIFAFLVKPLKIERLRNQLHSYGDYRRELFGSRSMSQQQIDNAVHLRQTTSDS